LVCKILLVSTYKTTVINLYVGSLAAANQAQIGLVGAGSLFAIVQSAAIAGYGLPTVLGTVKGGASLVCWGARALWLKLMKETENEDEPSVR
jgi:hypothetical protein